MKNSSPVYWKMRNGKLISVDNMDINHLRNVLKMIIRNLKPIPKQDHFLENFREEAVKEIENNYYNEYDF